MYGINLHDIVRPIITGIHPDEEVVIYKSNGQVNIKGIITPIYLKPVTVQAQVQHINNTTLVNSDKINESDSTKNFYLYANNVMPTAGLIRQLHRGGDIIKRMDDTFWLIYATPEEFSLNGWVCVQASLQTIAPDFSASPWYGGNI